MATKPPVEVPQGAIRLNTQSQKLEFYAQDQWWEMATEIAIPIGGRGLNGGGLRPVAVNSIDYINMESAGDAVDFGDLVRKLPVGGSGASRTRGIFFGGYSQGQPTWSLDNTIDYVTIASKGNAIDFGDKNTESIWTNQGIASNNTHAFSCGGTTNPSTVNQIVRLTISTTGSVSDFADMTGQGEVSCGSLSTPTRLFMCGGGPATAPSTTVYENIEYITMSTAANGTDFGDLTFQGRHFCGASNGTRGIIGGGWAHPTAYSTLQVLSLASKGDAVNFGDLDCNMSGHGACNSPIRSFWYGGSESWIQEVSFSTLSGPTKWGDTTTSGKAQNQTLSNAHGGV